MRGETPGEMCRHLRIQRAAWQLRYTDARITAMAMEAGLASSQAFARVFRRYHDCTPGEFRRDKSKNGHLISKDRHAIAQPYPYAESTFSARSIGDIVAAGLEFGNGPCFELCHSMSDDSMQADASLCSSLKR